MTVTSGLTPLSFHLLQDSLQKAHRRHLRQLDLPAAPAGKLGNAWDRSHLVPLVSAVWDQPPARIAHLFGVEMPEARQAGKAGRAIRESSALVAEVPGELKRVRAWAGRVFAMQWSQAQLLQVMEEIEPFVTAALYLEQRLAANSAGGFSHLYEQLRGRLGEGAYPLLLDLVGGLPAPGADLVDDLAAGTEPALLQQRYGHRADVEWELAQPRFGESLPLAPAPLAAAAAWDPEAAAARRLQAVAQAEAGAGLLQRSSWRRLIELVQVLFRQHAQSVDVLALALAAARRWCLAAAQEGQKNERLDGEAQLFQLQLEEIKQMMTGEWHSREHVQPLIAEREAAPGRHLAAPPGPALGLGSGKLAAPLHAISDPHEIQAVPGGAIVQAPRSDPAWAPLWLRAGGVVLTTGDLLCHAATVGRAGGVPTLRRGLEPLASPGDDVFELDPGRFRPIDAA